MLRHLLGQHAHVEGAETAAAVLARRTHTPQAGCLILARYPPVVFFGDFRRIGIASRFDRNNFLADYSSDLTAKRTQFRRQFKSVVGVHQNNSSAGFAAPSSPRCSPRSQSSRIHSRSYAPHVPLISGSISRICPMASVILVTAAVPHAWRWMPVCSSAPR